MIIRLKWVIEGIIDTITSAVILFIITNAYSVLSQFNPTVKHSLDLVKSILEVLGVFYLFRVATKKSWIVKEAIYSIGILIAAIAVSDTLSMMIAFIAIMVVLLRKMR